MNNLSELNEFDILDLLNEYQSEMRKLRHKAAFVNSKISALEQELENIKNKKSKAKAYVDAFEELPEETPDSSIENTSPPVENTIKKSATKKRTRKIRKKPGRKPQPLSQWDQMIYDSIAEHGRIMLSRDIYVSLEKKATEARVFISEEHTRVKLNQCLVKMTSPKRMDVHKVNHPGRGYAYAIPQWVDKEGNALPEFHLRPEDTIQDEVKTAVKTKKAPAKKAVAAKVDVPAGKEVSKTKRKRISKPKPEASSISAKKKELDASNTAEADIAPAETSQPD
jgi:hypothetical protein